MGKVHVISAAKFEAEPLLSRFSQGEVVHHELGIGALEAAYKAGPILSSCADQKVVFVGTAGLWCREDGFSFTRPVVYHAVECRWLALGERLGEAYSVFPPKVLDLSTKSLMGKAFPQSGLNAAGVICTAEVTLSEDAQFLNNLDRGTSGGISPNLWLENIELYSLCLHPQWQTVGSFDAFLATTNTVGKESHLQWKANHKQAALVTAELLYPLIKQLVSVS